MLLKHKIYYLRKWNIDLFAYSQIVLQHWKCHGGTWYRAKFQRKNILNCMLTVLRYIFLQVLWESYFMKPMDHLDRKLFSFLLL